MAMQQGLGLFVGDAYAWACGVGGAAGDWLVAEPARVGAPGQARQTELLLAGSELAVEGGEPLLRAPRRWGYVANDTALSVELLAALLATLRQRIPLAERTAGSTVPLLALSHNASQKAGAVLRVAAQHAGWGEVGLISELTALAGLQAPFTPGRRVAVELGDGWWQQCAEFLVQAPQRLLLERLTATRVAALEPLPEEAVVRGAAMLAASGAAVALAPDLPLELAVAVGQDAHLRLCTAAPAQQVLRAFNPLPKEGALLRLVAICGEGAALSQVVLEEYLEGGLNPLSGMPWLLSLAMAEAKRGEAAIYDGAGRCIWQRTFAIRLP